MCRPERSNNAGAGLAVVAFAVLAGASWLGLMVAELLAAWAAYIFTAGGLLAVVGVAFIVRELRHPTWGPVATPRRAVQPRRPALPPAREVPAIEAPRTVAAARTPLPRTWYRRRPYTRVYPLVTVADLRRPVRAIEAPRVIVPGAVVGGELPAARERGAR